MVGLFFTLFEEMQFDLRQKKQQQHYVRLIQFVNILPVHSPLLKNDKGIHLQHPKGLIILPP